jgi:hypothetical protein
MQYDSDLRIQYFPSVFYFGADESIYFLITKTPMIIPRKTNSNLSCVLAQYIKSNQDSSIYHSLLSLPKSENLENRFMMEITIINPPETSFEEVDLISPVKCNPEINNIERIVVEYKIQLRTSLMSPPYSK